MSALALHVDTDPGADDLLALGVALGSPELRLASLTTVAGNALLDVVTANASGLLRLAGCEAPLGRGAAAPLELSPATAQHVHGADGRLGAPLPAARAGALPDAHALLERSLGSGGVRTLVALGPLTNVARLARRAPHLLDGRDLVWMGGTLGPGNVTPLAEFNAYADPAALSQVLRSGARLRIVGLEVTTRVSVGEEEIPGGLAHSGPAGWLVDHLLRALCRGDRERGGPGRAALHDPVAVAALCGDLLRFEERRVDVLVEEGPQRGRLRERAGAPRVLWAVDVREAQMRELVLSRLVAWASAVDQKAA